MPGSSEWLIILGIALLLFGPKKLPQLGGSIGEFISNLRTGMKSGQMSEDDKNPKIDAGKS
ncbi:MAG: twin-arginine translocase TatA/TatE family subunit [Oligoflexales bacterium]|nr:twin-arginine translocase TatA/TatE family subunit [Oligoflexales bacterium]